MGCYIKPIGFLVYRSGFLVHRLIFFVSDFFKISQNMNFFNCNWAIFSEPKKLVWIGFFSFHKNQPVFINIWIHGWNSTPIDWAIELELHFFLLEKWMCALDAISREMNGALVCHHGEDNMSSPFLFEQYVAQRVT
jgi:hypothetical protein